MMTVQYPSIDNSQGLIWYKIPIGGRICWGHNGGDVGVSTNMYFSPEDSVGIITLANGDDFYSSAILDKLFDYAESLEPPNGITFECDFSFETVGSVTVANKRINLYPNPANEKIFVEFGDILAQHAEIYLLGADGSVLLRDKIDPSSTTISVDVSHIPAGFYIVRLINGDKKVYQEKCLIAR